MLMDTLAENLYKESGTISYRPTTYSSILYYDRKTVVGR